MPTIFAIDGAEFADFGAASQSVLALQTALKALGNAAGSASLKALVTDGLIGPKTTAATNLAFTAHLGPGQAPAQYRTGTLSQATVAANADVLGGLVALEVQRRGASVPTAKVIATVAKVAASKPAVKAVTSTYVPTSAMPAAQAPQSYAPSASDDTTMQIVKYGAIGLGVVVAAAGVYWAVTRRGSRTAMAGFDFESPSQHDMFYHAGRQAAEKDQTFLHLVKTGLTAPELEKLIAKRPALWGRYRSWLDTLPKRHGVGPARFKGAFGAGDFYHTSPTEFRKGQRVGLHPGLDQWMRGDRYAEVVKTGKKLVHVKTDHGYKMRLSPTRLEIID